MNPSVFNFVKICKEELYKRGLKRVGYCCQCGECCMKAKGMWFNTIDIKDFRIYTNTGPCKLFDKKSNKCKNHPHKKRIICKCWPLLPEHIKGFNKCTYKFESII